MPLKIQSKKVIEVSSWDDFVTKTYEKPYNFQQQDGCKERGTYTLTVPSEWVEDYENETVPENVNDEQMGVSFAAWLKRDPKQKLSNPEYQEDYCLDMWWGRNFYPTIEMIANDMHSKGLLKSGEYIINIDW